MTNDRARSTPPHCAGASPRPIPCARLALVVGTLLIGASTSFAQTPSGLPDVIRQRIAQSGLTPEQIRARLEASGYNPNLLDAYLGRGVPTSAQPAGSLELAAIQALGLPPVQAPLLPVDTGAIPARGAPGQSRVFGIDVFRRTTTQFLPLLSGPVPPDYRLGPGDVLVLILTGDVELAYTLQITREGFILIPQVGQVFVSNLTLDQLRDLLYTRLARVYSGVRRPNATTHFDISVANVRANQVYVVGEVAQPAAYQISSLGTVLTALYAGGGPTERANMRSVEVRRLGKPIATLDLYDYLLRGDTRSDIRLETGDVVFIPVHGTRAVVTGAIVRPAVYDVTPTETLGDLVRAAGGFRPDAQLKRLAVFRVLPAAARTSGTPARAVIDVALSPIPLRAVASGQGGVPPDDPPANSPSNPGSVSLPVLLPEMSLQDGDSVVVDFVPTLEGQYYVTITGMVRKPGSYPWHDGMTLHDLVLLARGPTVGADLQVAEIARMPQDRSRGQLATTTRAPLDSTYLFDRDSLGRYVGPPGVVVPPSGAPEVRLAPYDNVLILKQPEFDFQRTVTITGEVKYPGPYSLRTKTDRLADLIHRAGGLTRQAYPDGIRFSREVGHVGRINVNLARALADTNSASNIILQPGDSIEIPEYEPAVRVAGAVNSPGSVLWKKGEGLDYYLDGAGGVSYKADKGKVSVKYANGDVRTRRRALFFTSDPQPGPGSEVFVPVRDSTERTNYVQLFGSVAQIVASAITTLYVLKHL